MAEEIVMPRLGWTMTEGTLVEWLRHNGETVKPGDMIFTVETDKVVTEVETFTGGVLYIPPIGTQPGDTVEIGTVLAYLLQPGEEIPKADNLLSNTIPAATPVPSSTKTNLVPSAESMPATTSAELNTLPKISPRARRLAEKLEIDWRLVLGSGRNGRINENDIRMTAQTQREQNPPR